jgi:hypothetical protein
LTVRYLVSVTMNFDPDDYEPRWPPQLFIDEVNRLVGSTSGSTGTRRFGTPADPSYMKWLLTEVFTSAIPAEAFEEAFSRSWGEPTGGQWISELVEEVASWPEPGTGKPYWTVRTTGRASQARMSFQEVTQIFVQLIDEFQTNGYFVNAFGYTVLWPLQRRQDSWTQNGFCDLVEVFHDLVARPSRRWYHDYSRCGWHYSDFATGPARRLYRWRINRMLAASTLGLSLAQEGEDLGRLVRVEPTGLEDLPERAVRTATPQTVDRVGHAIALFRSRNATVEERRSAVIALAGILEGRRKLLKEKLLSKDEGALFKIANEFAIRHQNVNQRGEYDSAYLDWLFWWYLGTVELTNHLLARQAAGQP